MLGFSLAKDLNLNYKTNDMSVIMQAYDRANFSEKLQFQEQTLFDFGGFVSSGVRDIVSKSDIVIIPTRSDANSILKTISTMREISKLNKKVVVVANMITSQKEAKLINSKLQEFFQNFNIFFIRNSKVFNNALNYKQSVREFVNSNNLNKHTYRGIYEDYCCLLNAVKTHKS